MRFNGISPTAVGLLAALTAPVSAFWRLPCSSPVVVERADPIVNPGGVASHVHTIMGGNGFGFNMDYAQARAATCSTCKVTQDMSNYWVPTLYYKGANGSFSSVDQNGGMTVYYLQRRGSDTEKLYAFPPGFRMLAGNPTKRSYDGSIPQQAISFVCLGAGGETKAFPNKNCKDGLRAQVFFPSCWDGKNLDSPDHKSHMAYPSSYNGGKCPPGFPKRVISIFYEVIWSIDAFKDMWPNNQWPFVLSTGDPTGYGYHGDFVNGWDTNVLQTAIDTCNDNSGNIELCKAFNFYPDGVQQDCKIPQSIDEQVFGLLPQLPGCNPVQAGPAAAVAKSGCGAPTTIGKPQTPFTDLTASKGWKYAGCAKDLAGQSRSLQGATFRDPGMTVEKCIDFCSGKGFKFAGTEFSNECYCGNTIAQDRAPVPSLMGKCDAPCAGNSKEICGGGQRLSLYEKCSGPCNNAVYGTVGNNAAVNNAQAQGTTQPTTPYQPAASSQPSRAPAKTDGKATGGSTGTTTGGTKPAGGNPVYGNLEVSNTGTTGAAQSPDVATPTSTTASAPVVNGASQNATLPVGWKADGCYVDPVNPRALTIWAWYGSPVTSSGCVKECNSRGFKFAGTENGGQCFCGSSLDTGATVAPSSECDKPCKGDAKETCGGSARLSVFSSNGQAQRRRRGHHISQIRPAHAHRRVS